MQTVWFLVVMVLILNCGGGGGGGNQAAEQGSPTPETQSESTEEKKESKQAGLGEEPAEDLKEEVKEEEKVEGEMIEPPTPGPEAKIVFQTIVDSLLIPSACVNCHQADYQWVKNRIAVGDAENSPIVRIIESGAMPRGGPKVKPEVINTLKQWIEEGATHE